MLLAERPDESGLVPYLEAETARESLDEGFERLGEGAIVFELNWIGGFAANRMGASVF